MCGIIGILGRDNVAEEILDGLRRLEYRGYDSAGIATLAEGRIERRRAAGKIHHLAVKLEAEPLAGRTGIGHTRWATHGQPNEGNAHPHATERVAVVHNGIIENYATLKTRLESKGAVFQTETDTEVIAHYLDQALAEGQSPQAAVEEMLGELEGAFALAILFASDEDLMIGARRGTPLAVGYGAEEGCYFLASDAQALAPLTNRLSYLEEGDYVCLSAKEGVRFFDAAQHPVKRDIVLSDISAAMIGKGKYRHFMHKEIHEQPQVLAQTLSAFTRPGAGGITLPDLPFDPAKIEHVTLSACGTAYYAAHVARYWLERLAGLSVELDIASEFRYREPVMRPGQLALFTSQSGETLDTLEALRYAKEQGQHILSVVNVKESSIARASDLVLHTLAGPEIGVASSKAFTTQLAVLFALALKLAKARGRISEDEEMSLLHSFRHLPAQMAETLTLEPQIMAIAQEIADRQHALFIGRGLSYPIALEGALKLKEVSYIHAEGYAAGELKHGPIALVDDVMPVITLAPRDRWFEKTLSNMKEIAARGGQILFISDEEGCKLAGADARWILALPHCHEALSPLLYALPMQLLAYHTAVHKGTDVDQPRNLAKSVTVE